MFLTRSYLAASLFTDDMRVNAMPRWKVSDEVKALNYRGDNMCRVGLFFPSHDPRDTELGLGNGCTKIFSSTSPPNMKIPTWPVLNPLGDYIRSFVRRKISGSTWIWRPAWTGIAGFRHTVTLETLLEPDGGLFIILSFLGWIWVHKFENIFIFQ